MSSRDPVRFKKVYPKPSHVIIRILYGDKIVISDINSNGIAHAVTVVGYAQPVGESQPSKLLIIDPNHPEETRTINIADKVWEYEGRKVGALLKQRQPSKMLI